MADESITSDAGDTTGATAAVVENLRGVRNTLAVQRVFGEAYEVGDTTVIPVARISGGAGGGGGQGTDDEGGSGGGFGSGFGLGARPVGVVVVADGEVRWRPTLDADLLARRLTALGGIVAVCITLVCWRRLS